MTFYRATYELFGGCFIATVLATAAGCSSPIDGTLAGDAAADSVCPSGLCVPKGAERDAAVDDGGFETAREADTSDAGNRFDAPDSQLDGSAAHLVRVLPALECVIQQDVSHYAALFSYSNNGTQPVTITGAENAFSPAPAARNQPTTFLPGIRHNAFAVYFDGTPITWSLSGATATASSTSPACGPAVFAPIADTYVDPSQPDQNFGQAMTLSTGTSLIQFDSNAIKSALGTAALVASARLEVTLPNPSAQPPAVSAYRMTESWTETGATWNCANATPSCMGLDNWTLASPLPTQRLPWVTTASDSQTLTSNQLTLSLDVSEDVREMLAGQQRNFGWALVASGSPAIAIASRESALPPRLVIQYSPLAPGVSPLAVVVDTTLTPPAASLTSLSDGAPRPLATFVGPSGDQPASFVANELMLLSDDTNLVSAFVSRWHGTVLGRQPGLHGGAVTIPALTLVRIDTTLANTAALVPWLSVLDNRPQGTHRVSSAQGLSLLAAAAAEAGNGVPVGVSWVAQNQNYVSRVIQDGSAAPGSTQEASNAFTWKTMLHNNPVQPNKVDTGVAEAWRAMNLAGKLTAGTIKVGIIDGGFIKDADWPDVAFSGSPIPFLNPFDTSNPGGCGGQIGNCPWHGTEVVHAGFGIPNNSFGAAGPGGPVSNLLIIENFEDPWTNIGTIPLLLVNGARIINMSFTWPMPAILSFTVLPFQDITRATRGLGSLIYASAGNSGRNTDEQDCADLLIATICWRKFWYTPCANDGVTCVGGVDPGTLRSSESNYGGSVSIYGPFTANIGQVSGHASDASSDSSTYFQGSGTSFSSPFVAGAASLIWASNTSQNANAVDYRLHHFARRGAIPDSVPIVNALDSVVDALGPNIPPAIQMVQPADGATVSVGTGGLNAATVFVAAVDDYHDSNCNVVWSSNVDGTLGIGTTISYSFPSLGDRVVTAIATNAAGLQSSTSITVHPHADPPTVVIVDPQPNQNVYQSFATTLNGDGTDPQSPGNLPCGSLTWSSSDASDTGFPATGCTPTVTFGNVGPRTVTLSGSDAFGLTAITSVTFNVVPLPPGPIPTIDYPLPNQLIATACGASIQPLGAATGGSGTVTAVWSTENGAFATILVSALSGAVSVMPPPISLPAATHTITLATTDWTGVTNSTSVTFTTECAQ